MARVSKVTTLDRSTVRQISRNIEEALSELAQAMGASIKMGSGSFSPSSATLKVVVSTLGDDGKANTPERDAFVKLAGLYGLNPEWIDQEFTTSVGRYVIVGLKPKAKRYPVLARKVGSTNVFKFSAVDVRHRLGGFDRS